MKDILGKYKLQSASLEKVDQPSLDLQVVIIYTLY